MKLILTFTLLFLSSCFFSEDGKIEINPLNSSFGTSNAQVSSVSIVNDQLVVNGSGLGGITKVQITGPSSFDHTFSIESASDSNLIANGVSNIAFALDAIFSLTVTDANGSATYNVTFTLQDDAVTTSKILDGAVTAAKLSDMGAGTGQVLKYNGTTWVPGDLNALTYAGTWDASTATAPNVAPAAGEYYIVSVAAAGIDISDGSGSRNFVLGDWLVYNGSTTRWDKIDNASYVTSFNGRTGAVTPATNDYTWAQIDKSASVLSQINDVEAPAGDGSDTGKVLKWNNATSTWELGDDLSGGGAGSVTSTEIADGSITNDDVNASAAIAYSKLNIADGDLTIAKTSGLQTTLDAKLPLAGGTMTGNIVMSGAQTVDGVDVSALATSVSTNTSTIAGLDTDDITEATNQYFTNARVIAAPITGFTSGAGTVAATDTVLQAIQKLDGNVTALDTDDVTEATNLYFTDARAKASAVVNSTAGTETDQAASVSAMKTYVAAQVSGAGAVLADGSVAMTGNLDLGNNQLRLKSDNTSYVQMIAPNSLAATYTLTMPADDGTSGQVLSTNGTGTLSWVSPASGSVTSVTGTAPIVSSGGTTPAISIAQANGSTDGFLDSADWTTFNNKQAAITTGTTAQYLRGDLSLSTFGTDVIGSAITGFTSGAGTVAATDTVLQAVQKLDGNIAANTSTISGLDTDDISEATNQYFTNARAIAAPITGFTSGAGTVAATDTVLQAIQKLDGNIAAAGDILDGGNTNGAAVTIGTNDAQSLNLETNNSTAMTISSGGNVGIGTTNPLQKLVVSNSGAEGIEISPSGGGEPIIQSYNRTSSLFTPMRMVGSLFKVYSGTTPVERLRVDGSGNLGIGTSSPTSNLELQGNLSTALTGTVTVGAGTAAVTGSGTAFTTELAVGDAISISGETFTVQAIASATALTLDSNHVAGATGVAATSDPNLMSIKTGDAQEVFTVNSEGNVGIGTTTPGRPLHIRSSNAGSITDDSTAVLILEQGTNPKLQFQSANTQSQVGLLWSDPQNSTQGALYYDHVNDSMDFHVNGSERLTVDSSGNVGIGTSTPSTALEVNGTVTATAFAGDGSALTGISATGVAAGAGTVGAPSMSFSTDTNTGFYSSGADQIGVSANGASIFDFTATGLTSPTTGGSHITTGNGTASAPTFSFAGDTDTGWYRAAADTLAATTAGSERMRIDSSGNVGVKTTSPEAALNIGSSGFMRIGANADAFHVDISNNILEFNRAGTSYIDQAEIGGDIAIRTSAASASDTTAIFIEGSNGNVGIGTTSPSFDLVVSNAGNGGLEIAPDYTAGATALQTYDRTAAVYDRMDFIGSDFLFRPGGANAVAINSSGNVGIGTTSASAKLEVSGGEAYFSNGTYGTKLTYSVGNTSGILDTFGNHDLEFRTNNSHVMTMDTSGNVGIGTTSPNSSALLDVSSTSKGFLPPRMTTAQRTAISTPAEGLMVFDTDIDSLYIYSASSWSKVADSTQVIVRAEQNSAAQSIPHATWTKLDFNNEDYDTAGVFDLTTDRMTATTAGYYEVKGQLLMSASASWNQPYIAIYKNGAGVCHDLNSGQDNDWVSTKVTCIVYLNGTTDYLEVYVNQQSGSALNTYSGTTYTNFEASLISGGSGGSADNLGNHTATQNVQLGTNYISNDGGASEGLTFDTSGNATFTGSVTATSFSGDGSSLTGISASDVSAGAGTVTAPSMSFSTDTNTGFYSSGADQIGVSANGASIFDFTATGLTSPTTGGSHMTTSNGTAATPTFSFAGDTDTGWYRAAADTLAAATAGSERVRIDSSGNVGIGTTSPTQPLTVDGGSGHVAKFITDYNTGGGSGAGITISNNATGGAAVGNNRAIYFGFNDDTNAEINTARIEAEVESAISTGSVPTMLKFSTGSTGATERMRINSSGNVGIGTTSPNVVLEASGAAALPATSGSGTSATSLFRLQNSGGGLSGDIGLNPASPYGMWLQSTNRDDMSQNYPIALNPNGGNVGIGTTSPSAALSVTSTSNTASDLSNAWPVVNLVNEQASYTAGNVVGGISFTKAQGHGSGVRAGIIARYAGTGSTAGNIGTELAFKTAVEGAGDSTERMRIDDSGNVGIGTATPSHKLHLEGNTGVALRINDTAVTNADWAIYPQTGNSTKLFRIVDYNGGSTSDRLVIDGSGNVGIGTTSPDSLLEIDGGNSTNVAIEHNDVAGGYGQLVFRDADHFKWATGVVSDSSTTTSQQNSFYIYQYTDKAGTAMNNYRFVIDNSGNVGIGTTAPGRPLEVLDNGSLQYRATANGTTYWDFGRNVSTGDFEIADDSLGTVLTIDQATGNVGIGTASPSYPLEVNSTSSNYITVDTSSASAYTGVRISSQGSADWFIRNNYANSDRLDVINGAGTGVYLTDGGTSWTSTSDERWKENWVELDNGLEKINTLRAGTYNYIDNKEKKHVGLVAQDVDKVLPEAVDKSDNEKWGVKYTEVIPLIVKSIQELYLWITGETNKQNRKIATLEKENKEIKAENKKIKSQMSELLQAVCEVNPAAQVCKKQKKAQ